MVLVLLLRVLMVRARCVRVREGTGGWCLGACPDMRVRTRCTIWLTQAVAVLVLWRLVMHLLIRMLVQLLLQLRMVRLLLGMLLRMLLGMLLVRHLVLSVRRDMLVDWLHVSLVTHHTQMRTITRSNARCVRELILELLLG